MHQVNWEDRIDRIRAELIGCPRQLIVDELIRVTRDFCQHTRALQLEVNNESIVANVSDYDIEIPETGVQPIAIEYLEVSGVQSFFKDVDWIQRFLGDGWRTRSGDDFRYFTQIQPRQITFPCVPTESKVGALSYRVSVKPELTSTGMDETFMDEWQEALDAGTKAHLMYQDGKPWYRPKRADGLFSVYRHERGLARIRVQRSYGNADQRVIAPRFA